MKSLALLKKVDFMFKNIQLKNTLIIANQHILGTTFNLFEHLFRKGLNPKNTYIMGKCYSTHKKTFAKFKKVGVNAHINSLKFNSHKSFDKQFKEYVKEFLKEISQKEDIGKYEKIIVLDDGGELISQVNNKWKKFKKSISAIEQTSSGYNNLKKKKIQFPIINVARSYAKLTFESPLIAEVVIQKIKKLKISPKKILVVGSGPIGKNIAEKIRENFNVINVNRIKKIDSFDMIIGCTGNEIFKKIPKKIKKKIIFVSASSSDREFSAIKLRKKLPKYSNCHKDIKVGNITLLNSGFPINFDGKEHSVNPKKIQLTRALILSGIYLALTNNYKKGFVPLNKRIQGKIIKNLK